MSPGGPGDRAPASVVVGRSDDGIVIRVRLTPKSSRDDVTGQIATADGPALQTRVRARPSDNAANTALIALLAKAFRVAKSSVTIVGGHKSRVKLVAIDGDPDQLRDRVAEIAG